VWGILWAKGSGAKSIKRDFLISIIAEQDLTNGLNGLLILILLSVVINLMQSSWFIGGCEVNSHHHIELDTSLKIFQERWFFLYIKLPNAKLAIFFGSVWLSKLKFSPLTILHLIKSECALAHKLLFKSFSGINLNVDRSVRITIAKSLNRNLKSGPIWVKILFYCFWFVNDDIASIPCHSCEFEIGAAGAEPAILISQFTGW